VSEVVELTNRRSALTALAGVPVYEVADPRPDIRVGVALAFLFFFVFLGWASMAPLDAVAAAPGRLVVSGERQSVQHRDGGIVTKILVKEGDRVQQGQVLIALAGAEVRAQEQALASQAITLLAQRARLEAQQADRADIVPPPEFASLPIEERAAAAAALRIQKEQLLAQRAVLQAQEQGLGERTAQAENSRKGYASQVASLDQQIKLIGEELASMRSIEAKGFVAKNRLRELERAQAELIGQRGQYFATMERSRNEGGESHLGILEARSNYLARAAGELRDVVASLDDVLPKLGAVRDQLARTEIRSPATGTVVGLAVFTPGGVIGSGQKLMDIVPDRAPLTIEARISPNDVDDVQVGQRAFVRFDALHERSLPALKGTVTRLSADSFTDERTGASYFTALVSLPKDALSDVRRLRGSAFRFHSGMPVSIQIPLRKRTALQYAFEPLTSASRSAFGEH